jgi:tetratricopeptide (TPR) repeat protein
MMKVSFRRFVYNIFFRLSPLLILILLELSLRFLGVGQSYRLFELSEDKSSYVLNPRFYGRFMVTEQFDSLAFPSQRFSVRKTGNTQRIFLIADQSLFTLIPSVAETPLIQNTKNDSLNFEYIQLAVPHGNSFTVRRILRDIRHYDPDACVVLSGGNEFYGLPRKSAWVRDAHNYHGINAYIYLKKNRFLQILERFVYLKNDPVTQFPPANIDEWGIPRGSQTYTESRELFRRNLKNLIRKNDIPVFVATLPLNLKQAPFRSDFSDKELSDADIVRECSILVSNADRFTLERWINELKAWEPETAAYYYCQAMIDERREQPEEALQHYRKAVEEDIFRVRPEPDINEDIRNIVLREGAMLIDMEKAFLDASGGALKVQRLFTRERTLNPRGQALLREEIRHAVERYFTSSVKGETWQH